MTDPDRPNPGRTEPGAAPSAPRRKPPGMSWESYVERQIQEARERGDFDDRRQGDSSVTSATTYDENWWIKEKLHREKINGAPPTVQLRLRVERERQQLGERPSVDAVRGLVAKLNDEILATNAGNLGPLLPQPSLDPGDWVRAWKTQRDLA